MKFAILAFLFFVFIALTVVYFFPKQLTLPSSTSPSPAPTTGALYKTGDVNQDGKVDISDTVFFDQNAGCKKADPCWSKVVGYTLSGHNPIYASDLDLNKDGMVNSTDASVR